MADPLTMFIVIRKDLIKVNLHAETYVLGTSGEFRLMY